MILDKMKLDGKVAIVTGGTSGIGASIAIGLAEAGANVVPVSRTPEKVRNIVEKVKKIGSDTLEMTVDTTIPNEVDLLVEKVMNKYGKIDILVNSAGMTSKKPFLEQSQDDWNNVLNVNLNSIFICCKKIGKQMVKQRKGKIINIASIGSVFALINSLPYCVSKGGLLQLTRTLAAEWATYNINVNAIAPAYFETPMTKGILENRELYDKIIGRIPMGRLGDVEEINGLAVFLASEASSYITGEMIFVDGGFSTNCI